MNHTTPTCRYYALEGKCKYGDKCRFRHASRESEGMVATELDGGVGTSAFVANAARAPTPPPGESNVRNTHEYDHSLCSLCSSYEGCSVRDESDSETCVVVGTSIAYSACSVHHGSSCRRWIIIDSGAGLDLISGDQLYESERLSVEKCENPRKLRTANGVIHAENRVTCNVAGMQSITALVLDKCPPVLSLGR
eukprot:4599480-Amphidinium_carterae.1